MTDTEPAKAENLKSGDRVLITWRNHLHTRSGGILRYNPACPDDKREAVIVEPSHLDGCFWLRFSPKARVEDDFELHYFYLQVPRGFAPSGNCVCGGAKLGYGEG